MYVLAPHGTVEKFPYSLGQLRKDNPQTSFPKNPSEALLASYNVFPVVSTGADYDPETQVATQEGCHYSTEKQRWETSWVIRDLTAEELEQRKADELEELKQRRASAYIREADPLFFKAQRGEILLTEWEAKVDEIRNRYPYPEA